MIIGIVHYKMSWNLMDSSLCRLRFDRFAGCLVDQSLNIFNGKQNIPLSIKSWKVERLDIKQPSPVLKVWQVWKWSCGPKFGTNKYPMSYNLELPEGMDRYDALMHFGCFFTHLLIWFLRCLEKTVWKKTSL